MTTDLPIKSERPDAEGLRLPATKGVVMRVLRIVGRVHSLVVLTIAKTIDGMSEKKTFDHDNATSACARRESYRP